MKIKKLLALLLAGMMLFSLASCKGKDKDASSSEAVSSEADDPNYPVSIGDIRIAARPETIVSLSPALTEIICELGGADRLAGVSDFCDYPAEVDSAVRCGSAQLLNRNAIEELAPQVVFASANLSQEDTVWLQQMDAEVVILPRADSIDALEELYVTAATVLDGIIDGEKNGMDVFARLRGQYDALKYAAQGIETLISGVYLRSVPLMMATGDTFEGTLLQEIGIQNDAKDYTGWVYPEDKAVDLYPDVIFYDRSIDPEYFKNTKIYSTTDAVKNGNVVEIDATAFERQSGRMFSELVKMFKAAYPDVTIEEIAPEPESTPEKEPESEASSSEDEEILDLDDATEIKVK